MTAQYPRGMLITIRERKQAMKIAIIVIMAILIITFITVAAVGVTGGFDTEATPTPTPSPPPAEMEPQEWSYIMFRGNLNAFSDAHTQLAFDRIKERTDGLLDIQTVFHGTLPITGAEQFRAVSAGDLEMGLLHGDYHSADFPLFGVINIPWVAFNNMEKLLIAEVCYPIFRRELAKHNIVPIAHQPYAEVSFNTVEDFPNIMDVGGVKIRAQAVVYTYIVEAINGTPVPIEWGEAYTALQTGVVKGIITGHDSVSTANIQEVAPYGHRINMVNFIPWICVNKEKWDALPIDVQLIMTEEIQKAMVTIQASVPVTLDKEVAWQLENGLEKYYPTPPEGWFDLMAEKVTQPMLEVELAKAGAVGLELIEAIEAILGRSII